MAAGETFRVPSGNNKWAHFPLLLFALLPGQKAISGGVGGTTMDVVRPI